MKNVLFILDEAASLQHMDAIDDAVDKYRGYGVRLIFLLQSVGQLKKCFPDGQEQTLLSNTTQIFFGVNDQQTAEMVSARLGETTILVRSGGRQKGTSHQYQSGRERSVSNGSSGGTNEGWQEQARKLLTPQEVIALPARFAITFTPGLPPICTKLLRFYEEKHLGRPRSWFKRWWSGCTMLARSAILCALSIALAGFLTTVMNAESHRTVQQPDQPSIFQTP